MDSRETVGLRALQSAADQLPVADVRVQRFVSQAFEQLHSLTARVTDLESEIGILRDQIFVDGDHRLRLESMVVEQTDALARAEASLARLRALIDATRWAGFSGSTASNLVVQLDDVERAIASQP